MSDPMESSWIPKFPEIKDLTLKLAEKSGMSPREIEWRIQEIIERYFGLVSPEGAAHILASELGVDLIEEVRREKLRPLIVKIRDIHPSYRVVNVEGRVFFVDQEPISFKRVLDDGRVIEGRKLSFKIGDDTGTIRVTMWNDKVDLVRELKEGDVVRIMRARVRVNKWGRIELHSQSGTTVEINPGDAGIYPDVEELKKRGFSMRSVCLAELTPSDWVETRGMIVSVSERRTVYPACPVLHPSGRMCGKSLMEQDGVFLCSEHGEVKPALGVRLRTTLDDGEATAGAVFWHDKALEILGLDPKDVLRKFSKYAEEDVHDALHVIEGKITSRLRSILGKTIVVRGFTREDRRGDIEIFVTDFREIDPVEEANRILNEVENRLAAEEKKISGS